MAAFLQLKWENLLLQSNDVLIAYLVHKKWSKKLSHVLVRATLKKYICSEAAIIFQARKSSFKSAFSGLKKWDCFKNPFTDSERF